MGILLKNTYRFDEAIGSLTKALKLKPDLASARYNLGAVYLDLGFNSEAEQNLLAAIELNTDFMKARMALAMTYKNMGLYEKALDCLKAINVGEYSQSKLAALQAEILYLHGNKAGAKELIAEHAGDSSAGPDTARILLKLSEGKNEHLQRIEAIEELLSSSANLIPGNDKVLMHLDLGKAYDGLEEYDKAFAHYRTGNDLKKITYDRNEISQLVDYLISHFNRKYFDREIKGSNPSGVPVFIVGMPRSGTSLVEQILASHPLVFGAGELHDINNMTTILFGEAAVNNSTVFDAEILSSKKTAHLASGYINKLANISDSATRVTDKMPHNFKHLWLIANLFPGARIIHVKRNPIDTCLSCYFQNFVGTHAYSNRLEDLADYYLQYQRLMEHWQSVLPTRIFELEYESLVENQEEVSRLLVDFVGLEWDEACLNYHENRRIVLTASQDQVRKPIYRRSVARWRHYEKHLAPLLETFSNE